MKKRPNLVKWCMMNIKPGTKLFRKGKDKHEAITKSFVSMETQVLNGKEKKIFGGIALCERYFREVDGTQLKSKKKNPENGWEYWGIKNDKDEWISLYSIYKKIPHEVLEKRCITETVEEDSNETV